MTKELNIEEIARQVDCLHVNLNGDRSKAIERLTAFAVEVAKRSATSSSKPIYMVSFVGLRGASESGVWSEASEEAFYTFAEQHRRIVFAAAPQEPAQADAQAIHLGWDYRDNG